MVLRGTTSLAAVLSLMALLVAAGCGQPTAEEGETPEDTAGEIQEQEPSPDTPQGSLPAPDLAKDQETRRQDRRSTRFDTSEYEGRRPDVTEADAVPDAPPAREPYTGNLTPEKAAEITTAVAKLSLAEIPSKDLPKDPKVMMEINERIRAKSEELYKKYDTTMSDVARYVSDLSPKQREAYNRRLTELLLEESKKKYGDLTVK